MTRRAWSWILPSRARIRADLDEELAFYFEERTRELIAHGVNPDDATAEARREFGDVDATTRYCLREDHMRTAADRRFNFLVELRQDVRLALRTLRRSPLFAAVILSTLALGVGGNAAVFSVVHAMLLRDLPYRDADRVVRIYGTAQNIQRGRLSAADLADLKQRQRSFERIGGFSLGGGTYIGGGDPQGVNGVRVDADVFPTLGTRPFIGRLYQRGDDSSGAAPTIVLSHRAWLRLFNGDSGVVGRAINLSGVSRTVIGVTPPAFVFPTVSQAEVFLPLSLQDAMRDPNRARNFHFLSAIGRLRDAVPVEQGASELRSIAADLERAYPASNTSYSVVALPLRDAIVGDARPMILLVFGASVIVLLIACANVAGMLLARGVSRRGELAVRASLGAGRGRLVRQLLTESMVIAAIGGAAGIMIGLWALPVLVRVSASALPSIGAVGPSTGVIGWMLVVCAVSTLIFGLVPAFAATKNLSATIRASGQATVGGRVAPRMAIVTGQIALASALLIGAGLLVRTLRELQRADLGFSPDHTLTLHIGLPGTRYPNSSAYLSFYTNLEQRLRSLPGVTSVGFSGNLPLEGASTTALQIEGKDLGNALPEFAYLFASDDYFTALQIPVRRGRAFDARDTPTGNSVVVISDDIARRFWPAGDAVGARVRLGSDASQAWSTIVGVVGETKDGTGSGNRPTIYSAIRQDPWSGASIAIRTAVDPLALIPAIRREVREIDPLLAMPHPSTMVAVQSDLLGDRRLSMRMTLGFALMALCLATVGLFGVVAYTVATRTREIGIRVALGAAPASVVALIGRQVAIALGLGLLLGGVGGFAFSKGLSRQLYGVSPLDPVTLGIVAAALVFVSLVACLVPARRALRIHPASALRGD